LVFKKLFYARLHIVAIPVLQAACRVHQIKVAWRQCMWRNDCASDKCVEAQTNKQKWKT